MIRTLKTAPLANAILRDEIKDLAFINNSQQDQDIDTLIPAATDWVENKIGQVLINQTWEIYYDLPEFMNVMQLSNLNVNSIVQVSTFDTDNVETVVSGTTYRLFNNKLIFNESQTFSANLLRKQQAVKVEVIAGFGATSSSVPAAIRSVLAQLVKYWMDTSGTAKSTDNYNDVPLGIDSKLMKYVKRVHWL